MAAQFKKMKKYSEFKNIPGSKGYQINSYGFIFDKHGSRLFTFIKDVDMEYVALVINGVAEELSVKHLVFNLFGVKYTKERRELFNMRLAMRK